MEPTHQGNKKLGLTIAALAVLVLAAVTIFTNKKSDTATVVQPDQQPVTDTTTPTVTPTTTPVADKPTKTTASIYKDGTYSATGVYVSPGGGDQIGVTLTLKNDIITDISVTPKPGDNTSARFESIFAANYKPMVLGKNIATVQLSKVSGSSLTSRGFNDALNQIKAQAKA